MGFSLPDVKIQHLKDDLLRMASYAQIGFLRAWKSFEDKDIATARDVIVHDEKVNVLAERMFKKSLEFIALHAPVARDLRTIGAYLKIVTDLERIGDLSVEIAKVVVRLNGNYGNTLLYDIPPMAEKVKEMIKVSISCLEVKRVANARSLDDMDDIVDDYFRKNMINLENAMKVEREYVSEGVQLLKLIQHLERIGDHATNIGEWAIYMSTGSIADLNT